MVLVMDFVEQTWLLVGLHWLIPEHHRNADVKFAYTVYTQLEPLS